MTEVLPLGTRNLDEISSDIRAAQQRMVENASQVLMEAIRIGEFLLEAQKILPENEFGAWADANVAMAQGNRSNYMRLAYFKNLLPREITNPAPAISNGRIRASSPQPAAIKPALNYIKALGLTRYRKYDNQIDADEIRRLSKKGMTKQQIAKLLAIDHSTVTYALMSSKQRREFNSKRKQRRRERERLLRRARQAEAIKVASPDLAEAYSLIRKCLQHAQAAHDLYAPGSARKTVVSAIGYLHKAEDALARAHKESQIHEDTK